MDSTCGCVLTPVAQYETLPWHGHAGDLPTNPLVLMGLVEGLALQAKAERQREKKRKCGERGEEDDGDGRGIGWRVM